MGAQLEEVGARHGDNIRSQLDHHLPNLLVRYLDRQIHLVGGLSNRVQEVLSNRVGRSQTAVLLSVPNMETRRGEIVTGQIREPVSWYPNLD